MTDAELETEVKRLVDEILRPEGFKVYDTGRRSRTDMAGMRRLLGLTPEGMRSRVKRSNPPLPVKFSGRNTFRVLDYVMLCDFENAA
jgi:hypothetical protein